MTDPTRGWEAREEMGALYAELFGEEQSPPLNRHYAILRRLQAAYQAGQKSMVSDRVCANGHAQYAIWSVCFICAAYDAGQAAVERVKEYTKHRLVECADECRCGLDAAIAALRGQP